MRDENVVISTKRKIALFLYFMERGAAVDVGFALMVSGIWGAVIGGQLLWVGSDWFVWTTASLPGFLSFHFSFLD